MSRAEQTYESAGECAQCFMPRDDCECPTAEERARVRALENNKLARAANIAIARGYAVMGRRRSIWQMFRDAWWAFWHGLG